MTNVMVVEQLVVLNQPSLVALALVVIIGLPHGAFDGAIARHLGYGREWCGLISFIASYLGLAGFVVAFWIWFPGLALALFLLLSAVHFGCGDATASTGLARTVQIAAHGGVAVFGICLFHLSEVKPLFSVLTGGDITLAVIITEFFPLFIVPIAVLYLILAFRNTLLRPRLVELAVLCLLISAVPPLVGFAIYFCVLHTGRHMQHIWTRVQSSTTLRQVIMQAGIFTVASWIVGAVFVLWLDSGNISQDLLQVIFIGLAALTVPHVILVDGLFRRNGRKGAI